MRRGLPSLSLEATEAAPLGGAVSVSRTKLLGSRDGSRPPATVGWTRGEDGGRPVQLHGVRLHRRALVRQVPGLLGLRDARGGGHRAGLAVAGAAEAAASARRRRGGRGGANLDRGAGAGPRAGRWARPGLARLARRRAGSGEVDAAADRPRDHLARPAGAARHRRGVGGAGEAARRAARRGRGCRDPGGDRAGDGLPDAPGGTARCLRDRLRPDALRLGARLRAGIRRAGARGGGAASTRGEGVRRRDDPRRARDEGRLGRRAARARAPRRLRAPVRGRPVPRASRAAGREEPLRLDQRARRVRDDGSRPRRRARSVGSVRAHRPRRARSRRRVRAGGYAADPARDPGARGAERARHAPPRRDRHRPEAARHDRRRALTPRKGLARPGGRLRQRRRRRPHRRAGRRPRRRARHRLGRPARAGEDGCRGVRGDRPHGAATPRCAGRATPRGVREAGLSAVVAPTERWLEASPAKPATPGRRPRRLRRPWCQWQNRGRGRRDAAAGNPSRAGWRPIRRRRRSSASPSTA